MKIRKHHSEIWLRSPQEEVFRFFSDASKLNEITPDWLNFRIDTPRPVSMKVGTLIDYRMKIRGIPVHWQSEIALWDPPYRFIDIQTKGPYKKWVHTHHFETSDHGTLIRDIVEYVLYGWIFESLIDHLFVQKDLERIFAYRRLKLIQIFDHSQTQGLPQ